MLIYQTSRSFVIQEELGYRVMTRNNICIGTFESPVHAIQNADWINDTLARAGKDT